MKECNQCHKIKPLNEFHKHSKTRDGHNVCCKECQYSKYTQKRIARRHNIKIMLIKEAGGRCEKCGYDKCPAALEFHHKDPNTKDIGVSDIFKTLGITQNMIDMAREEIKKCRLLCANCHREEHYNGPNL